MGTKRQGRYTVMFEKPPIIRSYAAIVGEKEAEGPLGAYFDTAVSYTHLTLPTILRV